MKAKLMSVAGILATVTLVAVGLVHNFSTSNSPANVQSVSGSQHASLKTRTILIPPSPAIREILIPPSPAVVFAPTPIPVHPITTSNDQKSL